MRELDTSSPVIWPSWCYTGVGEPELEIKRVTSVRMNGANVAGGGGTTIEHLTNNNNNNNNTNNNNTTSNNNNNNSVKAERLSPPTADNNSSSSRSGTPVSSYEGTPPTGPDRSSSPHIKVMDQVMTRNYSDFMRSLAAKYNHANPNDYFSTTGTPQGRNGFPGDPRFVSGFKTGVPTPFVGLMAPLSSTTPTPSTHNTTNTSVTNSNVSGSNSNSISNTTTTSSGGNNSNTTGSNTKDVPNDSKPSSIEPPAFPPFTHNPFVQPGVPPIFPPMIDMSSTQALLNMVRSASAHSANQLENYLKGAIKRGSENPLDLSASKKPRKSVGASAAGLSLGESLYGDAFLGLPMLNALNRASKEHQNRFHVKSPKPSSLNLNNVANSSGNSGSNKNHQRTNSVSSISSNNPRPQCLSVCSERTTSCSSSGANNNSNTSNNSVNNSNNCDQANISSWTVDDVINFVLSIDICAEYAPNFREQRIDGSALPLLTEQHLTTALQMKLGPALKLRAILSRRLGHCAICLHCVHCHGSSATAATNLLTATAALTSAIPPSSSPKPTVRPNSTGN